MAGTRQLNEAINYFEQREELLHENRKKMDDLLCSHHLNFLDETAVKKLDEEGNVTKKVGVELLDIDLEDSNIRLKKNCLFIGQQCSETIKSLGLTPSSSHLNDFFKSVFDFYLAVAKALFKYFKTGLSSTELDYMSCFHPGNRKKVETPHQIRFLSQTFSKVVENIRPGDGLDKLKEEVEIYNLDEDIKFEPKEGFDEYWGKVAEIEEGEGWNVFEVLPRFARALGTQFNSNSEVERGFSVQSDVHRNPKRSQMSHNTLDCQMQVKYGIESKESKAMCDQCKSRKIHEKMDDSEKTEKEKNRKFRCSCHCDQASITDSMRKRCAAAGSKYAEELVEKEKKCDNKATKEETAKEDMERTSKMRESLKSRMTLYKLDKKSVYETKEEKKEKAIQLKKDKIKEMKEVDVKSSSKLKRKRDDHMERLFEKSGKNKTAKKK